MVVDPHRNRTGEAVEIVMGDGHLSSGGAGHAEVETAGNGHHDDAVEAAAVAVLPGGSPGRGAGGEAADPEAVAVVPVPVRVNGQSRAGG